MSVWQFIRGLDEQFSADDAPLWAEVLGPVLVLGLLYRNVIHIWTALAAGEFLEDPINPELGDHDVTLASPVVALRGHRVDRVARLGSFVFGLGAWFVLIDGAIRPPWATAFIVVNITVLLGDPVAFVIDRARAHLMHRDATNATTAHAD